jgi:5-methylcytosine-specific restriction enzyme B
MPLAVDERLEALRSIFRRQIIPYLQELFFDDWSRIRMVLNDHRKSDPSDMFVIPSDRNPATTMGPDYASASAASWILNPSALTRISAYARTIEPIE